MGDAKGVLPDEAPHAVTLTKGYWIQKTEVTQAQWQALMGTNPSEFVSPDRPVNMVSWNDCQAFLEKLNAILDKPRRAELPTEAEWEYACRAGGETRWAFGDDPKSLSEYAWYDVNALQGTEPVGKKRPNAWGIHDMHGNVWEWCADWYGSYKGDAKDPTGPGIGTTKVLRGGGWASPVAQTRCASRNRKESDGVMRLFGFRVVLR
ncbi:MAG: formylglycine-generating enzyme family protein [Planctomycetales bacterium]|nr:formylglycine-generating enzyme family protein [Planctomycetales bacterium]